MIYSSCLTDAEQLLVLDASVVINLLATRHANAILHALDVWVVLPEAVVREVEGGELRGHGSPTKCQDLFRDSRISMVELDAASEPTFVDLVAGTTSSSLGDGEAATIALARSRQGCAVIDEKKANRLLTSRFPEVRGATTIDILSHERVHQRVGRELIAEATMSALTGARMQVREAQFKWVEAMIGTENAKTCVSLRRFTRRA